MYVCDNTDILVMRDGLEIVRRKLGGVMRRLAKFSREYKDLPTLAYTHLQPAQITTVGKRASLWLYDFYLDYNEVNYRAENLALLGNKGATGTQASFCELLDGDAVKIDALERDIAEQMGLPRVVPVSGQTYSRKVDFQVLSALAGIAQSAAKLTNDLRLAQSFKEMEEPFEKHQIGSSAMPYKRNPMRSERVASLARYVTVDLLNPALTASAQMFERTLDDSANRRISVAEAFLATDAILNLLLSITDGLLVFPNVILRRMTEELPFMATENIMMNAVKNGGDRQALHERIREHAMDAAKVVKEEGRPNDLLERVAADKMFGVSLAELEEVLQPERYTGRAAEQAEKFLSEVIEPLLETLPDETTPELNV